MIEDHPNPETRWKNRRRMAWLALIGLLAYPALFLFADSEHLASVAWPVMATLGGIVGAYVGFATWESVKVQGK
jgi:hypothetical protein